MIVRTRLPVGASLCRDDLPGRHGHQQGIGRRQPPVGTAYGTTGCRPNVVNDSRGQPIMHAVLVC